MSNGQQAPPDFLERLRVVRAPAAGKECPDSGRLRLAVAGLVAAFESDELMDHAAVCAWCGPVLREAVLDLAEPESDEEKQYAATRMADRRTRRALARSLAQTRAPESWFERLLSFEWVTPQLAAACIVILAVAGGIWMGQRLQRNQLSPYAAAALQAHRAHLRGTLPLAFQSSSETQVAAWFKGKLPVAVKLPDTSDLPPQQLPYQIEGGSLVPFSNGRLGYVAYRVGGRPVSLLIAPASAVTLSGHKQVPMKSLVIHYDSAGGYHIVTWMVPRKQITYALVSESSQNANESCIVCHASPKDRDFMRGLLSQ